MIPALPVKVELYFFDSLKIISNDQFEIGEDVSIAEMTDLALDYAFDPQESSMDIILKLSVAKSKTDFKYSPYRISCEFHVVFKIPELKPDMEKFDEVLADIFIQCVYDAYGMMRMELAHITSTCRNTELMLPTFDAGKYFTVKKPEQFN